MYKYIFLFCISVSICFSQTLKITPKLKEFLAPSGFEDILEESAKKAFLERGISEGYYHYFYNELTPILLPLCGSILEKKLRLIEYGFQSIEQYDSNRKQRISDHIRAEIYRAIRDGLGANLVVFSRHLENQYEDKIISFHSQVNVSVEGDFLVTETITVINGPSGSIRGIYREFPTMYTTKDGFLFFVPFEVIEVKKNGVDEPYLTKSLKNGNRLYIGRESVLLENGVYVYTITYKTNRQLMFLEDETAVYWNVNGNGWDFKIEKVSYEIVYPKKVELTSFNCFTGVSGSKEQACSHQLTDSSVVFTSNKELYNYEGLTVYSGVKPGIISAPSTLLNIWYFFRDNFALSVCLLIVSWMFFFNLVRWIIIGIDPKKKTIVVQYYPPDDISPVDAAFLYHKKFKKEFIAIAMMDLAAHKMVKIHNNTIKRLLKNEVNYTLSHSEQSTNQVLVRQKKSWYGIEMPLLHNLSIKRNSYNSRLDTFMSSFQHHVKNRILKSKSGKANSLELFALNNEYLPFHIFLIVALSIFCLIVISSFFATSLLISCILVVVAGIVQEVVFHRLLKSYTPKGREVMDWLEGFRIYLSNTEAIQFNALNSPDQNIELFEKYMPYAMAMNCEMEWTRKFESVIKSSKEAGYSSEFTSVSGSNNFKSHSPSSSLFYGDFARTISSASTPPCSASDSSSGGGGW